MLLRLIRDGSRGEFVPADAALCFVGSGTRIAVEPTGPYPEVWPDVGPKLVPILASLHNIYSAKLNRGREAWPVASANTALAAGMLLPLGVRDLGRGASEDVDHCGQRVAVLIVVL